MGFIAVDDIVSGKTRGGEMPAPSGARSVVRKDVTNAEEKIASTRAPLDPFAESIRAGHPIEGGFAVVREDLERRTREGHTMVRLLDQYRQQLETAERERDASYAELARIVATVQDTARDFKIATERCKAGERGVDLAGLSARNGAALEDLERIAGVLNSHFLSCRVAWEQYARTIVNAQRLRNEIHAADQRP
jgi:hypothetical protein